jgi:hypothetical protein
MLWKALTPALRFAPGTPSPKIWERGLGGEGFRGAIWSYRALSDQLPNALSIFLEVRRLSPDGEKSARCSTCHTVMEFEVPVVLIAPCFFTGRPFY